VSIDRTKILRARAFKSGLGASLTKSAAYQISSQVSAGSYHSMAVVGGSVWAWGRNDNGQLGLGSNVDQWEPRKVGGLSGVVDATAGWYHSLAVDGNGDVWGFGNNDNGRLGLGTTGGTHRVPEKLTGMGGVAHVAAGEAFSLALKGDGSVWGWGYNGYGQVGDGTTMERTAPVTVSGLGAGSGVVAIAAGRWHSLAVKSDGTLWGWGYDYSGQLGSGTGGYKTEPMLIGSVGNVVAVSAGDYHTVVLKGDGTVWCAGGNGYGQLGTGGGSSSTFVQVPNLSGVVAVGAGSQFSVALKSDGTLMAWGYNSEGELGNGGTAHSGTPVAVSSLSGVVALSSSNHTLAVRNNGAETIWAWGYNSNGQVGNRSMGNQPTPFLIDFHYPDTDGDGILDWEEYDLGTNPMERDTNGDGIDDQNSIWMGISPTSTDDDGDGIPNLDELLAGTNPLLADTDRDGCADLIDAFPLDPALWDIMPPVDGDTTPPTINITEPSNILLIP